MQKKKPRLHHAQSGNRNSRKGRLIKTKLALKKTQKALTNAATEMKDRFHDVKTYARYNPLKTIGISALAGVLLAQIMRYRQMHRF